MKVGCARMALNTYVQQAYFATGLHSVLCTICICLCYYDWGIVGISLLSIFIDAIVVSLL